MKADRCKWLWYYGGVRSQKIDGEERVIGYYSRVECVRNFHKYLYGRKFHMRSDRAALGDTEKEGFVDVRLLQILPEHEWT